MRSHVAHGAVRSHMRGRDAVLTSHSLAETYAVLTRLPAGARVDPGDAARLVDANFGRALALKARTCQRLPALLAPMKIAGGAVYDVLVALAALEHDVPLATRDARALPTYRALGVAIEVIEG